jgi:signal transduction histidine kinase/integral membrane sensor domain MASE1
MRPTAGLALALTDARPAFRFRTVALRRAGLPLLVFAGYYLGAQLGFALTFQGHPVSMLWSPNSVLMAAFILAPVRSWWLVLAGAFPAHLATQLGAGVPAELILLWFMSNSAEGLLGAVGVRAFMRPPIGIDRLHNVGVLVVFAGVLAPFLSSFLDAAFVRLMDWGEGGYWSVWRNRFFSNVLAALTVVPVVLAWATTNVAAALRGSPRRYAEAALIGVSVLAVTVFVFGGPMAGPGANAALLYVPLPFLVWATIRVGPVGGSTAVVGVVFLAIWYSVHGRGPFVSPSPEANALTLQLLFAVMVPTLLALAAVLEERRRARDTARKNSEQLRLALDAAQMRALDWAVPTHGASADPPAGAGGAQDSLDRFLASVHPQDRRHLEEAIRSAVSEGASYQQEFRVVQGDGSVAWVLGKGKVLRDEEGRPARVVGVQLDITDKKAADALTAAENRILGMIAGAAPLEDILSRLVSLIEAEAPGLIGSVLLLDPDGVHMHHGAAPSLPATYTAAIDGLAIGPRVGSCGTAMYLGYPVVCADIETDPLWEEYRHLALAHGLRACWSTPILSQRWKVMGSFAIYHREPRRPTPGETELLEFATHLAAIALERERAEAESEEQRRELTHLGRVAALGGFSGALAHELSQPLASILSNAQAAQRLMDRDPPALAGVREILADIVSADRQAAEVIDRLRAMLTNHQGERSPVDLNRVTADALQLAGGELRNLRVQVELELADDLPLVLGDPVQLGQVALNLIANACEAMGPVPAGERHMRIVTRRSESDHVHWFIADRGVGVAPELAPRLYEPFVTSKTGGLGLGLSISRTIVGAHGGRLWFESNLDGGTIFHLRLPRYDVATTAVAGWAQADPEPVVPTPAAVGAGGPATGAATPHAAARDPTAVPVSGEGETWQPLTHQGYVLAVT